MKGFFQVQTPEQILQKIDRFKPLSTEKIPIEESLHRVLAEEVISSVNIPEFPRSTVDGFALKAKDTYGASEKNPVMLKVVGEIPMAVVSEIEIKDGEAIKVATGGVVPKGADAVEMIEYTEWIEPRTLFVTKPITPMENVIQIGEDVKAGDVLLQRGHFIRPQEVGLMAGIGKMDVRVYIKPRVGLISSGDEIVPIEKDPAPGEIRDINRYTITSMIKEMEGIPIFFGIAKDRFDDLKEKIEKGLKETDFVVITGGSSVGTLDLTCEVLRSFPKTEIHANGISIRPGKPTILAEIEGKPLLGLPGHPVSAMVIFYLFGKPILRVLSGLSREWIWNFPKVKARAGRPIPSIAGREDYVRVKLEEKDGTYWAQPIFGKSGAIAHLASANGLLKIGIHDEGVEEGEEAEVFLI
ncbi:MAG: molybdopterin molybdotransferase MoeA [Thermodesulfobacteriota bacterium]